MKMYKERDATHEKSRCLLKIFIVR